MATTPQTSPYERNRVGEGWQLFRVPSRQADWQDLPCAQAVCHQRHEREQPQQNRGGPSNRQVAPLSLRFHTQMRARFFEGDFHTPTPHKPGQDLQRRMVDMRRKKGLRIVFALRVAHQYPAQQDRVEPRFVPHTGLRVELNFPRLATIPMRDGHLRPRCVGIIQTLLRRGTARPFHTRSSILSGLSCWSRIPQLGIHPQSCQHTSVRYLTDCVQQLQDRKTAVTDKDQLAIRQPPCEQPYDLPSPLGQFLMHSSPFSMVALRGAEDRQAWQAPHRTGPCYINQQHATEPPQPTGFDQMRMRRPYWIAVDAFRLDFLAAPSLNRVIQAKDQLPF